MQSNLDSSFSESGAINSGASSHPARSDEPTRTADNVVEIAPDNSSLDMLASMATSLERVARDSASRPIETRARIQTDTSFAFSQLSQSTRAHYTQPQMQEMSCERPTNENNETLSQITYITSNPRPDRARPT